MDVNSNSGELKSTQMRKRRLQTITDLPEDILEEIFLWIPDEFLYSPSRVCRLFNRIISESQSVRLCNLMFFSRDSSNPTLNFLDCSREGCSITTLSFPFFRKLGLLPANSCHGLVCFHGARSDYDLVIICNPVSGDCFTLPLPDDDDVHHNPFMVTGVDYGFGYSPAANQFQVLRMLYMRSDSELHEGQNFLRIDCVYTLGKEESSWRKIGENPSSSITRSKGIYLENAVHWIGGDGDYIISFDFEVEEFREILPPAQLLQENGSWKKDSLLGLGVLRGCLAVSDHSNAGPLEIWVMKEYGVERSWTKKFNISPSLLHLQNLTETYMPLHHLKDGRLLLAHETHGLLFYDPGSAEQMKCFKPFGTDLSPDSGNKSSKAEVRHDVILHSPNPASLKNIVSPGNLHTLDLRRSVSRVPFVPHSLKDFQV